jgi:hypothetical protein
LRARAQPSTLPVLRGNEGLGVRLTRAESLAARLGKGAISFNRKVYIMPLETAIVRNDELLPLRWGAFHVCSMIYAIAFERKVQGMAPNDNIDYPNEPQGLSPENIFVSTNYYVIAEVCPEGTYTLKQEHRFQDLMDGEVLHMQPGDELHFSRVFKDE